jgi:predicted hydrocarbon binding protein
LATDININHNIFDNSARKSGGAGTSGPPAKDNSATLAKEIGKVLEKVSKDSGKNLSNDIKKALESTLRQFILKSTGPRTTGGVAQGSGGGLSSADITKIINNVTKKGTSDLLRELTKLQRSGSTRSTGAMSSATERQIQQILRNLNSALGSKGITLPPEAAKTIGNTIASVIDKTISKEVSKSMQEATKAWGEIKNSASAAQKAFDAISKIKKSGGGIDVKEIGNALSELKNLAKSLGNLKKSSEDLNKTVGKLATDQKELAKETGMAIKAMKEAVATKTKQVVSDIPSKLINKENYKKQFNEFLNEFKRRKAVR